MESTAVQQNQLQWRGVKNQTREFLDEDVRSEAQVR